MGQSFVPNTSDLLSVEVAIKTLNRGRGGDTLQMTILEDGVVLATMSQSVPEGFEGWLRFELPHGGTNVNPRRSLVMELEGTGKLVFCWHYAGDTYPDGTAIFFGSPDRTKDFVFRVNRG